MQPAILIAGVGNIFHGDDGFGSAVAQRLLEVFAFRDARVVDFGIRGYDLAFALQDGYAAVILIDVIRRGVMPGTLTALALDPKQAENEFADTDSHMMNPTRVLSWLQAQAIELPPIWLIGCEPDTFGPDEGQIGLSQPVAAAIPRAVALIHSLLEKLHKC